jgi:hypothetical protein
MMCCHQHASGPDESAGKRVGNGRLTNHYGGPFACFNTLPDATDLAQHTASSPRVTYHQPRFPRPLLEQARAR